ncbi:MAG TPA: 16S rRNA (uracil(1498)-N(3))-methyltransferase [Candidatus Latescibacteria bacterium]|nr:16S rRNA (uracil(1498)-N(3))-methyltransferase [Candidatus Latescibacterota bacterium]
MGCRGGERALSFPVFYVRPEDVGDGRLVLKEDEVRHMRVLRLRPGDRIEAVDGRGRWFLADVEDIGDALATARKVSEVAWVGEPEVRVTLGIGLIKGERFDFLVEKSTELGVHRIFPLLTSRTVRVGVSPSKAERWRRIAKAAMKQCRRSWLPDVSVPVDLEEALREMEDMELKLVAWEEERRPLEDVLPEGKVRSVGLLVGPEGGFREEEVEMAEDIGFVPFSLGPRRLRSETAGILALGVLLYLSEELRPYVGKKGR